MRKSKTWERQCPKVRGVTDESSFHQLSHPQHERGRTFLREKVAVQIGRFEESGPATRRLGKLRRIINAAFQVDHHHCEGFSFGRGFNQFADATQERALLRRLPQVENEDAAPECLHFGRGIADQVVTRNDVVVEGESEPEICCLLKKKGKRPLLTLVRSPAPGRPSGFSPLFRFSQSWRLAGHL